MRTSPALHRFAAVALSGLFAVTALVSLSPDAKPSPRFSVSVSHFPTGLPVSIHLGTQPEVWDTLTTDEHGKVSAWVPVSGDGTRLSAAARSALGAFLAEVPASVPATCVVHGPATGITAAGKARSSHAARAIREYLTKRGLACTIGYAPAAGPQQARVVARFSS